MTGLFACNEDHLTPSDTNVNYFKVPDNAMDEESVLRRNFFQNNNSYLLFNDTLRHEHIGKDAKGNDLFFCETVDLSYSLTNLSGTKYVFDYISTLEEKKAVTAFTEEHVFPNMNNSMRPYSILLVDKISLYSQGNIFDLTNAVSGTRCTAIAMHNFLEMTQEERQSLRNNLFHAILVKKLNELDQNLMTPFYSDVTSYYGNTINKDAKTLGFLGSESKTYYSQKKDLDTYIDEVLTLSETEFMAKYASYSIIKKRYQILRPIIENVGFTFDK